MENTGYDNMVTGRFRMPQRRLIGYLYSRYGRAWTIGLSIVTTGLVVTAFLAGDVRWAICALMILFLVAPVMIAWLYLEFALDPECAFNVLDHRLELTTAGVEVSVWPKRSPDDEGQMDGDRQESQENVEEKEETPILVRTIFTGELGKIRVGNDYVVMTYGKRGILYLPLSAFDTAEEMQRFMERLTR